MDVSSVLAAQAAKYKPVTVAKETPPEIDIGLLTITDPNPVEDNAYKTDTEAYLQATARDGVQLLFAAIFALPTQPSPDGPQAILPTRITPLPRSKPLPKPKPMTKWQKFANAKGIQHRTKQRHEFDEEKQEWVSRWGKGGKNRQAEEQWLHEIPANAPNDYDPRKTARDERKERIAKNKQQQESNKAHVARSDRTVKKTELEQTLARTRISTASLGKFDKKFEGEPKLRGVKRKYEPIENTAKERSQSLAIASKLDRGIKRPKKGDGDDGALNIRKAMRHASGGKGSLALARGNEAVRGKKATKFKSKR